MAAIINREFIAVKVDRDERPDVDSRYQLAVSAISGTGGWPLTVFLTPDGKPFYGGTYFPPVDQWGRPSFKKILLAIADAYRERRDEVLKSADEAMNVLANAEGFAGRHAEFSPRLVGVMVQSALPIFDEKNGGFGSAPKFPHPAALDLLMDWYVRTREERVATVVTTTLTKMAQGGVYDQLAGGFHRYSVDERWMVPHFEKMAYDNSELLKNYVHGYQVFGYEFYAHVARDIVRWMDEWLSDREHGGFYASQDADINLDDDGDYFTWTLDEAKAVLSGEELEAAAVHFDIGEAGEMHHNPAKNVLWVRALPEEIASRMGLDVAERARSAGLGEDQDVCRASAAADAVRGQDGLHQLECACASRPICRRRRCWTWMRRASSRCARWTAFWPRHGSRSAGCLTSSPTPRPSAEVRFVRGMLDDYAFTVLACLDAYEVTGAMSYFKMAQTDCRRDDAPLRRRNFRRILRHRSIAGRKAASSGRCRRGASPFRMRPLPPAILARRLRCCDLFAYTNDAEVSRQGRGHAGGLCRARRAVRHLCRDVWHCGDLAVATAHAGGGDRRGRAGAGVAYRRRMRRSR